MDLLQREHREFQPEQVWYGKVTIGIWNPQYLWTAEDRAKVTINCLYKVTHHLLVGAKMYDFDS